MSLPLKGNGPVSGIRTMLRRSQRILLTEVLQDVVPTPNLCDSRNPNALLKPWKGPAERGHHVKGIEI